MSATDTVDTNREYFFKARDPERGLNHTWWYWDGRKSWFMRDDEDFRLQPSHFTPAAMLNHEVYIEVDDPRPPVYPPVDEGF